MDTNTDTAYDRSRTGWELDRAHVPEEERVRPGQDRVRCGPYIAPNGDQSWGDHRVTYPGTTCIQVQCTVAHSPYELPGWAERMPGYHDRPGVRAVAAVLWGWDGAGMLSQPIGDVTAWVAAHNVLDALRDAGYTIVPPTGSAAT